MLVLVHDRAVLGRAHVLVCLIFRFFHENLLVGPGGGSGRHLVERRFGTSRTQAL